MTARPPRHSVDYVDQLLGDDSAGEAPSTIAYDFHPDATRLRSFDVIHVTDGSIITGGPRTNQREQVRRAKQFVRRIRRGRVTLVRTIFPNEIANSQSVADSILNAAATAVVTLSDEPRLAAGAPHATVIPHSHLRARFLGYPRDEAVVGRALLATTKAFGEADEAILKTFSISALTGWTLRVTGKVPSAASESYARTLAGDPEKFSVVDDLLSDATLVMEISRSEIVIIAAPDSYEGQSRMLLALSLDRPVLVPQTPTTQRLAEEVGEAWVRRHPGPLTAHTLESSLRTLRTDPPIHRPNLELREPNGISERYASIFLSAAASRD